MKAAPGAPVAGATAATTGGWRRALALAAWTAGLVAVTRLLLAAGATSLAVPLASFDDLSAWASETPPADMAMAVLRLAAIAGAVYLLAVTVLATLAHLLRLRIAAALVESISPRVVRRLVTGGSGIGLVVGGIVGGLPTPSLPVPPASTATATPTAPTVPPPPAPAEAPPTASMTRLPGSPVTPAGEPSGGGPGPGTATMTRQDEPPPGSATMTRLGELGSVPSAAPPAPGIDPTAWVVEPGDSFWSIAADVTTGPDGSPADERTVTRYWHALIEANRSHLADPRNPDLLVPGQHLTVPPPAG